MLGRIIWWSEKNSQGICGVTEPNGDVRRYFILQSRIIIAPQEVKAGDCVRFTGFLDPRKPDLLPLATGVSISEKPFIDVEAAIARARAKANTPVESGLTAYADALEKEIADAEAALDKKAGTKAVQQ